MEVKAKARFVRITPRKLGLVADLVRGKNAKAAEQMLRFVPKKGAGIVRRLLRSALANAEQRKDLDTDTLLIKEIMVHRGPIMRRWLTRSQGRANPILKRFSHIQLTLTEK